MSRKYLDRKEEQFRWARRNIIAGGLGLILTAIAVGVFPLRNSIRSQNSFGDSRMVTVLPAVPQFEEGTPTQYYLATIQSPYDLNNDGHLDQRELDYMSYVAELSRRPPFEEETYFEPSN